MFPLKLGSASHAELLAPPCLVAAAPIRGQGGGARALLGSESVGAPEVYNSTLTLSPPEISRAPRPITESMAKYTLGIEFWGI